MNQQARHPVSSLNFTRVGSGAPVLLLHALGGNIGSWDGVAAELAKTNEIIAVDLPGHGASPVLPGSGTFGGIADAIADFIRAERLEGVAAVGMSLGGRVALEMARRGLVGATVALAPGGFWNDKERRYLKASLLTGGKLSRLTRRALPFLTRYKAAVRHCWRRSRQSRGRSRRRRPCGSSDPLRRPRPSMIWCAIWPKGPFRKARTSRPVP